MPQTVHCAAIDLGATSGRVIVGTWSKNRLELTEVHRFPNQFRSLGANDYWDLPYLWGEARAGLLKAKARFPKLASVGCDAWGVDHVLVNAAGRPVYPVHAYRDKRTLEPAKKFEQTGYPRIYALTGLPSHVFNTSLQLQETLAACPGIARTAARCLFIADYFNFLLSGRMENEISICSHSQFLDVKSTEWSGAAMKYFGIPRHWFSRPALAAQKLGPVRDIPELAGVETVLAPGHDTACAFAAMPAAADGSDLYLSSGTWSLLGFESDTPVLGEAARAARVSNERMGDGRYRPLRSCLGLWLLEQTLPAFAARPANAAQWRKLIALAEKAPAPARLLDVTDAALFNPPDMRAAIDAQLKRAGARPPRDLAGYVRLICDSLGRGHADAVRSFEELSGRQFRRILIVGGGSKNRLLCQATADASGLPVVSYALEGTAVGNVANQLIGLGVVRDIRAFRAHLARQLAATVYTPRR
ncbi:rhamnulokinase [Oleiharenicola sp. Vm1]|uniref:rhamnulokinase n=1 Tax=Oleiharenicola sp. Vm1 TaxID=3398393 RepID=UPI0039F5A72B